MPGIVKRMRTLVMGNQALGAACVFESHLSTHPVIRLNTEALVLAVQIYTELNRMEFAMDIVDFVEECGIEAPEVFNALLRSYIRRGEVSKAEDFVLRMKQSQCEITPDLYFKLAQLFATNGREEAIKEIHQEALMWFPEDAHRIQSVLIRYYLANDRMEDAQSMMRDMYIAGVPFHGSIFAALLETRLRHNMPDAIFQTLEEMHTLGVTPNSEFSISVLNALLKTNSADMALDFLGALKKANHLRTPQCYHLIMKYHLDHGDHVANIRVYNALRQDGLVPLSRFSFMRVIPSLAAFSMKLKSSRDMEEQDTIRETLTPLLLMVLNDLIASPIEPEPMSVGYLIDLLAREHPKEALRLAKHGFSQLRNGTWKRTAGAINATAYGLYHYGTLEDQCTFAEFVINSQIIPPAYVIAIITRQMKHESAQCAPDVPTECRFDLPEFINLLESYAFHLELPTYIVDRFATALIERGLELEASQMFAAAMQSLKPIDQRNFNSYKDAASWLERAPEHAAYIAKITNKMRQKSEKASSSAAAPADLQRSDENTKRSLTDIDLDHDLTSDQLRQPTPNVHPEVDVDHEQRYSTQYDAHPQDFSMLDEEDSAAAKERKEYKAKLSRLQDSL